MQRKIWSKLLNSVHAFRMQILVCLFLATLICFWPGITMHDSNLQYMQAVSGVYTDHHPPLMAFIWHYLDLIYPGPGLMFLLQLLLVYTAVWILMRVADALRLPNPAIGSLLLLILPIYPQILIYLIVVLKDVHFAASFLLSAAILAYYTLYKKRPHLLMLHFVFTLMIYGAAVKHQGQYAVILLAFWLGCLHVKRDSLILKFIVGSFVYALVVFSIICINHALVPQKDRSYAWEYVKLYDLAAISIKTNKDLIPEYNKTPNFSLSALKQRFKYPAVDPIVFMHDPLLKITKVPKQMRELQREWWFALSKYPLAYIKHRINNLQYVLVESPGWSEVVKDVPLRIENDLKQSPVIYSVTKNISSIIFFALMSHLPVILLGILYLVLAIYMWRSALVAKVLFAFVATALLMVALVFAMSMAGTPRYTFMSVLLIHATHIFAYSCVSKIKKVH